MTDRRTGVVPAATAAPGALPPHAQLVQMGMAHWVSHIVYVAARLGIADHLARRGATDAETLAGPTGTHAPSLYRLLRTLASLGLLSEDASHRFTVTPLGDALRDDAPGAARATILTLASDWWMRGFGQLLYSVQTGRPGFEHHLGMPIFDWLARNPDEAAMFSQTMVGFHGQEPPAVAEAYDFTPFRTIVDVGGATGNLLAAILASAPGSRGILFDLPHVVAEAAPLLASRGLTDRVTIKAGSFFDRVPAGGDAYVLSHVVHDWSETQCLQILGRVRDAMSPASKLLIVEMVLPEGNEPHPGKMLDLMMLVGPGGRERTGKEYGELLDKAGLTLTRVVPTASAVSVVEATHQ